MQAFVNAAVSVHNQGHTALLSHLLLDQLADAPATPVINTHMDIGNTGPREHVRSIHLSRRDQHWQRLTMQDQQAHSDVSTVAHWKI